MKKLFKIAATFVAIAFSHINFAQSDGCTGVPSLTMGSGSCSTTAFSLPGSFSNGGLVNASCATSNDRDDGWFSFTTGASQTTANLEEVSTNQRHLISVWTACGGGTEIGCNQQNSGITATLNLTGLSPSTTYYVQIHRRGGNNTASISGDICVYEPIPTPPVKEDCNGGTTVCNSGAFTGNSSGSGNISDLNGTNSGCLASGEHESSWYYFKAQTAGTFAFTIQTSVDYDFAVWGPLAAATCPPVGAPLRCSYSGIAGNTGLQAGAGDQTEGSGGDAVVDPIVAAINDVYILVIDNYTSDASSFNLNWTLTNGASLDCTPLPVEMSSFQGFVEIKNNLITWETKSESNSHAFSIERSFDGEVFEAIGEVKAAGNSSVTNHYSFEDFDINHSKTYYRLKMIDLDLSFEYSHTISLVRDLPNIIIYPNPTNGAISFDFGTHYKGNYHLVYINLIGEKIYESTQIEGNSSVFNSSLLLDKPSGIYFVQIEDENGNLIQSTKLIKE
jgi:hypothetical protein